MRLIPVMDLKNGVVVRGIGGRREEYRPIVSRLADSCQPLKVARAFRENFGLSELYLADLDAIGGAAPAWGVYGELLDDGFTLQVDAGVRDQMTAIALGRGGVQSIIVGLETLPGPEALPNILGVLGSGAMVFSLDLKHGEPLGSRAAWGHGDAQAIAENVVALGVRRMIVLDLAAVGVGSGMGTEALCQALRERHSHLELVAGGGVRGIEDVKRMERIGVAGVLVASALHDGRIGRNDLGV